MCVFSYVQHTTHNTVTTREICLEMQTVFAIVSKYFEPDRVTLVIGHWKKLKRVFWK